MSGTGAKGIAAIREKMLRTGLTGAGHPLWSEADLTSLRSAWPDRARLRRALPHRTGGAIERQGAKLGLTKRKRNHVWTNPQVKRLKSMWCSASQSELLAAFPWASWDDLMNKAQDLRRRETPALRRPKPKPRPTGNAVLDSLLDRAYVENLTLHELDRKARTGRYFGNCRFRRYIAWDYIARAVVALGGELDADWSTSSLRIRP
jgi:hypothetical protein